MQKLLLFLTAFLLVLMQSYGREFKPFKVDLGFTLNTALGDESENGAGGYIEPRYGASDEFTFGLRIEWNRLSSGNITINTTEVDVSSTNLVSTMVTGEYFFNIAKVRPFVGLAMGTYRRESYGVNVSLGSVQVGNLDRSITNFGFAPRMGINAGHLRLATIMNFTGNDISNFFGLNVGFEIGGGRQ